VGSGKSHFFGELMVEECLMVPGTLAVCIREVQKSLMQSSKRLIESKIQQLGVGDQFKTLHDRIIAPGDGLIIFQGMQDATAESIKSLEGFRIAWVEEAQTLSQRSLSLLRPTIRTEGSQLWANWNPRRKSDAIDDFLRAKKPDNAVVVQANWRDNPWFPDVLDEERRLDFELYPERYAHIWEGDYAKAFEGAYFAKHLEQARKDGRIGHVPIDPVLPVKAFFDIGGAGHSSDATAIWVCQFVDREIRLLDYIEGVGQPLGYYASELRRRGWKDALIHLPHDGVATNNISGKRYIDSSRESRSHMSTCHFLYRKVATTGGEKPMNVVAQRLADLHVVWKVKGRKRNRDYRTREHLTQDELDRLFTALKRNRHGHRDYMVALVTFLHGLRVSELIDLRWDDIDWRKGTLQIRRLKGSIDGVHYLEPDEAKGLKRLQREQEPRSR
jgi:phage terminase large subunit